MIAKKAKNYSYFISIITGYIVISTCNCVVVFWQWLVTVRNSTSPWGHGLLTETIGTPPSTARYLGGQTSGGHQRRNTSVSAIY